MQHVTLTSTEMTKNMPDLLCITLVSAMGERKVILIDSHYKSSRTVVLATKHIQFAKMSTRNARVKVLRSMSTHWTERLMIGGKKEEFC